MNRAARRVSFTRWSSFEDAPAVKWGCLPVDRPVYDPTTRDGLRPSQYR